MARQINKLNARTVATATDPGRHSDGGGLYLVVEQSGARRWEFRFRSQGRERFMGLGGLTSVPLADARARAAEARRLLASGQDPIELRRSENQQSTALATTFGGFADQLVPEMIKGFSNPKHAAQWTTTTKVYAAKLRERPIADVSTDDVLTVLRPLWNDKHETASRVRGRIERILDAAKAKGLRTGENPARWRGHLDQLLSKRRKLTRGHHVALPFKGLPAFLIDLRARKATSALALEFLILTAARSGEALGARWSEIDRPSALWTIPAARMKGGREHRVFCAARPAFATSPDCLRNFSARKPSTNGSSVRPATS